MGLLKDTLSIFKKTELTFKKKIEEQQGMYTFYFEKPEELSWSAGQHGLFTITHKKIKNNIRPFSIASSPAEKLLTFTTKINDDPSDYKQALLHLEEGTKMSMSGPVGSFYLKNNNPTLLIAGGVGITPFRAMLKDLEMQGTSTKTELNLVYVCRTENVIYKNELAEFAHQLEVSVEYISDQKELHPIIDNFTNNHSSNADYYVAGSKSFVEFVSYDLKDRGKVKRKQIHKDTFTGY